VLKRQLRDTLTVNEHQRLAQDNEGVDHFPRKGRKCLVEFLECSNLKWL
jgi:hypothetical protein